MSDGSDVPGGSGAGTRGASEGGVAAHHGGRDAVGGGRPLAVLDLDGTVADVAHRLHHLDSRPKKWDAFFAAAPRDGVLPEGRAVAEELTREHDIVWLTGRPERCRADTLRWLTRHRLPAGPLLMRSDGNRRPAHVVKLAALRRLGRDRRIAVVVDDDPAVVASARRAGFLVLDADWARAGEDVDALHRAQEVDGAT